MSTLYSIVEESKKLVYIGLTENLRARMANHISCIRTGKSPFTKASIAYQPWSPETSDAYYSKDFFSSFKVHAIELHGEKFSSKSSEIWEAALMACYTKQFGDTHTILNERLPAGLPLQEYLTYTLSDECKEDSLMLFSTLLIDGLGRPLSTF